MELSLHNNKIKKIKNLLHFRSPTPFVHKLAIFVFFTIKQNYIMKLIVDFDKNQNSQYFLLRKQMNIKASKNDCSFIFLKKSLVKSSL